MTIQPYPFVSVALSCFLFLCLAIAPLQAQRVALEMANHFGRIVQHTESITIQNDRIVWGQELNLRVATHGEKDWQQWHRFPIFGLSLSHFGLGEGAHGDAYGFLPKLTVPILRREKWFAHIDLGLGFGYITKPYDYFDNPSQNAIGAHWNGFTQFRFGAEARLNTHFRVLSGLSFSHFSNAGAALPNFGLNIPAGYCALAYSLRREPAYLRTGASKRVEGRRWGLQANVGLAYVEYIIFDGPRYPVWILSGGGTYAFNKANRLVVGFDREYNRSVYAWGLHSTAFPDEATARWGATRWAGFVADEFLFGDFGVQLQAGFYLGHKSINQYVLQPYYEKLIVRYYFPGLFGTAARPHVGIYLKAHKVVAEFISVNVGAAF